MEAAGEADLDSLIELWLSTKEIGRLIKRLDGASDAQLERLSHYTTGPAARRLARTHPAAAAKVFRAMGMRIINGSKSKYYDEALSNFKEARRCYEKAGLGEQWLALADDVRRKHGRKYGFMPEFERLLAGRRPRPSYESE